MRRVLYYMVSQWVNACNSKQMAYILIITGTNVKQAQLLYQFLQVFRKQDWKLFQLKKNSLLIIVNMIQNFKQTKILQHNDVSKVMYEDKALPPGRKTEILSLMFRLWSSSSCNLDRQGQQWTQIVMFFKYWYPHTIPHHIKILRTTISALWTSQEYHG